MILLPQHENLGLQRHARPQQIDDNPKFYSAEIQHPAEDHPILRLSPTVWNLRQGQASDEVFGTHKDEVANGRYKNRQVNPCARQFVSCGLEM
jgi:hypothetical protein